MWVLPPYGKQEHQRKEGGRRKDDERAEPPRSQGRHRVQLRRHAAADRGSRASVAPVRVYLDDMLFKPSDLQFGSAFYCFADVYVLRRCGVAGTCLADALILPARLSYVSLCLAKLGRRNDIKCRHPVVPVDRCRR